MNFLAHHIVNSQALRRMLNESKNQPISAVQCRWNGFLWRNDKTNYKFDSSGNDLFPHFIKISGITTSMVPAPNSLIASPPDFQSDHLHSLYCKHLIKIVTNLSIDSLTTMVVVCLVYGYEKWKVLSYCKTTSTLYDYRFQNNSNYDTDWLSEYDLKITSRIHFFLSPSFLFLLLQHNNAIST